MSVRLKVLFISLLTLALAFGFLDSAAWGQGFNFERLHIFLFNLCCGGTILIYYTEDLRALSAKARFFLLLSLGYAVAAFLEFYGVAIFLGLVLAILMETVRARKFSYSFNNFWAAKVEVAVKFHHAALLCLVLGLAMSALVIYNEQYLKFVSMTYLTLDTFFLGFSFPLSLISMAIIFGLMGQGTGCDKKAGDTKALLVLLKNGCFWLINLGVIIFFIFILLEKLNMQVILATSLFWAVLLVYGLFRYLDVSGQQRQFLSSGVLFLVGTAITGICYIILATVPGYERGDYKFLLRVHAFLALYGWNLSGLAVLLRYRDFPIKLHSLKMILGHWLVVAVLCPLGYYYRPVAVIAVLGYGLILYLFLFSKGCGRSKNQPVAKFSADYS